MNVNDLNEDMFNFILQLLKRQLESLELENDNGVD